MTGRQGRLAAGHVLLKESGGGGFELTVPAHLVAKYELVPGMEFVVEITDEGILYRPIAPYPIPDPRPAWRRDLRR